ncbi:MAG: rod shape-determining protein MreC [Candidatus Saganbacteria bacterium]|uniref:Cell shape-determining protein MreC n=1 Tax=Candidatus Saganbacteria bacterium TaxID=2575572 RepID=A0A833L0G1_UNCSA|nr:MAG: rod shape-determining protein MreC [Candidatus Saganbacteria bacterium]
MLVTIAVLVNVPQINKRDPVKICRTAIISTVYPLQFSAHYAYSMVNNFFGFIVSSRGFERESLSLKEKLAGYDAKLLALDSVIKENQSLRKALYFSNNAPYNFYLLPAEVIGASDNHVVINQGESDGAREGLMVINESGLVGRIIEVSKYFSKVKLITDSNCVISAQLVRSGTYGIVSGADRIDYIPEGVSIEAGDKVVVSPASSVFFRGILIGNVKKVESRPEELFQKIKIKTAVDFSKLDLVFICQP